MNFFQKARAEEMDYHERFYQENELFKAGTWLARPVNSVMQAFSSLANPEAIILDLGCGVGRNSIPLAQLLSGGHVVCVDLLPSAIDKLNENARQYNVTSYIKSFVADVEDYEIEQEKYDYIVACSCLEHVSSEKAFEEVVERMKAGTKRGGIHCIMMATQVTEVDIITGNEERGVVELNLTTEIVFERLQRLYKDWQIIQQSSIPQQIEEDKGGKSILYKSNWITFIAKN